MADDHDPHRRARQIRAFRDECEALSRDGIFEPTAEQRAAIEAHHARLLTSFSAQFDVDLTDTQQSLSLGLRLTTLVGAVALSIATVLLLGHYWAWFTVPAQVSVAVSAPVLALLALDWSAREPRRHRVTGVLSLVAFAAVVANTEILGDAFALAPSPLALLLYGVAGVALAYGYGSRLAFVAGACCLAAFGMTIPVALLGSWWMDAARRPETALIIGLSYIAASSAATRRPEFAPWWRGVGCALVGMALLMLSLDGTLTWIPSADTRSVEVAYTIMAFVAGLAMIVAGARRRWPGVSVGGALLIVIMVITQYLAWWWSYVPQWLFFLIVGGLALVAGLLLQRLRRTRAEAP